MGYPGLVLLALPVVALLCLTVPSFAWMVSIVAHRVFLHSHVEFDPLLSRRSPVCQSGTITLWCRMWIVFETHLCSRPSGTTRAAGSIHPKAFDDIIVDCHGIAPVMPCMSVYMYVVNGRSCRDPCYRMGHPLGRRLPLRVI